MRSVEGRDGGGEWVRVRLATARRLVGLGNVLAERLRLQRGGVLSEAELAELLAAWEAVLVDLRAELAGEGG